jgi:hypothetical protein
MQSVSSSYPRVLPMLRSSLQVVSNPRMEGVLLVSMPMQQEHPTSMARASPPRSPSPSRFSFPPPPLHPHRATPLH